VTNPRPAPDVPLRDPDATVDATVLAAIRFRLLQRLAPALRHGLMGQLQTVQFAAELTAHLLQDPGNTDKARASMEQVPAHAKSLISSCRDVFDWLREGDASTGKADERLRRCIAWVGDDWSLRGIAHRVEGSAGDRQVAVRAFDETVVAALFALLDARPGPLDILAAIAASERGVGLRLSAVPAARKLSLPPIPPSPRIVDDDVARLCAAHGVQRGNDGGAIVLDFALATDATRVR
jgi:hypothetical protein